LRETKGSGQGKEMTHRGGGTKKKRKNLLANSLQRGKKKGAGKMAGRAKERKGIRADVTPWKKERGPLLRAGIPVNSSAAKKRENVPKSLKKEWRT